MLRVKETDMDVRGTCQQSVRRFSIAAPFAQILESEDEFRDDLPPVLQFPIVEAIRTKFHDVGEITPLPFPELED